MLFKQVIVAATLSFILIFRIGENSNRKIGWFVISYFSKSSLFNASTVGSYFVLHSVTLTGFLQH